VSAKPARSPHEFGNILRLAIAQALAGANSTVFFATGAIVGDMLAPSKALATLPISVFVVGMAAGTLPAGAIAQRYGRRAAFLAGTGCGVLTGLRSGYSALRRSWVACTAPSSFHSVSPLLIACRRTGAHAHCRQSWPVGCFPESLVRSS
jgi:MFS family permease